MLWILWLFAKTILSLIVLIISYACFRHFKAMRLAKFYTEQGITKCRGFDTFFIGNAGFGQKFENLRKKHIEEGLKPTKPALSYILDQHDPSGARDSFDCVKHPVMLVNLGSTPMLFIQEPSIVKDIYGAKNALLDKSGKFEAIFKNFFGNSFVFSKGDNVWREKRKASSHAFYKDRLVHMIESLKEKIFDQQS